MASSNAKLQTLRHEILSYKPGKVVPCDEEQAMFPDKLVIGMIDLYGYQHRIIAALRHALYGYEESRKLAIQDYEFTEDREQYLTDSISVIMKYPRGFNEGVVQDLAGKAACMVLLFQDCPSGILFDASWTSEIKRITDRVPLCAMYSTQRRGAIEKARNFSEQHGINGIYEVPLPDERLSDEEQLQWLDLLRVCLQEGDNALLAIIRMNPRIRLLFNK